MKSQYIVIGNWKLNPGTQKEAISLSKDVSKLVLKLKRTEVGIAPSFVHLPLVKTSKKLLLGAQDVSFADMGAHTGEVSVGMLKNLGTQFVIVGHSERRALGESDELIARKVKVVLSAKMTPVVCIGESKHDAQGEYLSFLQNQIKASLKNVSRLDASKVIIAYEPIWAIGKRPEDAMSPQNLHETVLYIQKVLSEIYGREITKKVRIIYGGSVGGHNAGSLVTLGNVQGLLVGGASLSKETFGPILSAVDTAK